MDLEKLDGRFRSAYAEVREALCRTLGSSEHPVLVKLDDELILYTEGSREAYPVRSSLYHWLKVLSHIPLTLALAVRQERVTELLDGELQQEYLEACQALPESWEEGLRANNRRLLEASQEFLTPHEPVAWQARMTAYIDTITQLLEHNLQAAAVDEVCSLHRTVHHVRTTVLRDSWQRVFVVVCGSHQARYREPSKRYFQMLFREDEQAGASGERRVIYGEGIADEGQALLLLAGHLLDRQLGALFLRDPRALQQDVLGKAAETMIRRLFSSDEAG